MADSVQSTAIRRTSDHSSESRSGVNSVVSTPDSLLDVGADFCSLGSDVHAKEYSTESSLSFTSALDEFDFSPDGNKIATEKVEGNLKNTFTELCEQNGVQDQHDEHLHLESAGFCKKRSNETLVEEVHVQLPVEAKETGEETPVDLNKHEQQNSNMNTGNVSESMFRSASYPSEILYYEHNMISAIIYGTWDNILGPRIINIWTNEACEFQANKDDLRYVSGRVLSGELCRDIAELQLENKFFVLAEKDLIVDAYLFSSLREPLAMYSVALILPYQDRKSFLAVHRVIKNWMHRIVGKLRILLEVVRVLTCYLSVKFNINSTTASMTITTTVTYFLGVFQTKAINL